jgi:maleylpyruvate isomerase
MTTPDLTAPDDPAAAAAELSARLEDATQRLLRTAAGLTDDQAREPSLLPGWSRGHVLTHLARNADALRNLLIWARTGVVTPMYATPGERDEKIEAGAGRPAAVLLADLTDSASGFAAEAARLNGAEWAAEVKGPGGKTDAAWYVVWRRLSEAEIHHVDLGAGYLPADWPAEFAAQRLTTTASDFQRPDCPRVTLRADDSAAVYEIGTGNGSAPLTVTGPTRQVLAWLIGRSDGADLVADPAGPLPPLPSL